MDNASKRRLQLGAGFAVFAVAMVISYFSVVEGESTATSYDIFLAIDVSGSMADASKLDFAKSAALEFVDILHLNQASGHRVGLVAFSDTAYMVTGLTDDRGELTEGISSLVADGGTAIGDGILESTDLLNAGRPEVGKAIVLLSDGMATAGVPPPMAAITASEHSVKIFSVGYGYDADVGALRFVSSTTNGEYIDAQTGEELADAFGQIAEFLISPVSHYSSRVMILVAIPILLFIPAIGAGITTMMGMADAPVQRNVSKRPCPHCKHPNRHSAKFCLKCGKSLEGTAPWSDDAPVQRNVSKRPCPHCKHPNRHSAKFCLKCGKSIAEDMT